MNTILNIKTDKRLKQKAKEVADEIGVPLSTVINSFLKQFVRDKEVTFSTIEHKMTPYLESLAKEASEERNKRDKKYFATVDDFAKSLNS